MNKKFKFPEGFLWGSATAAAQIEANGYEERLEGGIGETNWGSFYKEHPNRFFEQKWSSNNFYNKYEGDLQIAKDLNFNSLRLSTAFARLFPNGMDKVNQEGVDFYHKVFDEAKEKGIKIILNLFHFDMPKWLEDKGGFLSKDFITYFVEYAKFVISEYGQKVDMVTTMNEPIVPVAHGYWTTNHYPGKVDFRSGLRAMWNTNIAHLSAVKAMRKINPDMKYGIVVSIEPAIPRSDSQEDIDAARFSDLFEWRGFSDTIIKGQFPQELIDITDKHDLWPHDVVLKDELELIKEQGGTIDFMGINFYQPVRIQSLPYVVDYSKNNLTPNGTFYQTYDMPGKKMNPYRGWEIFPKALYKLLGEFKNMYNNLPVYISENGMGVEDENRFKNEKGQIQDSYRINFIKEHLYWIHRAIEKGSNVFGYHMWTYIDNWSWTNAYKNRYGYIELDLETGERKEKLSASWIRNVIKENTIEGNEDEFIWSKVKY